MAEEAFTWIQSEQDERTRVGLAYEPSTDPYLAGLRVRVETGRLQYEGGVLVSADADGLATYFASLLDDWRGWNGVRRWDALEHGMSIEANHRGRIVELVFVVRRDYKPDAWELRIPVFISPGETLTRVAKAVSRGFPETNR